MCALLGYLSPMLCELFVIAHMPASVLTLIVSMTPLATLGFAWIMKTDRITPARLTGTLVGAIAIFAILLPDAHSSEAVAWRWLLLATLVPLRYALLHNYVAGNWPKDSDTFQVACGEAVVASLLLIGVALFNCKWQDLQSWNHGHGVILLMAGFALADVYIYFELIRMQGPIYASHANYFMVASGIFWGMVIFAESPGPSLWLSAALLCVSLYLINRKTPGSAG